MKLLLQTLRSIAVITKKSRTREHIIVVLLYVLLLAGGLWHVLGLFQTAMQFLAAPMIAALSFLLYCDFLNTQPSNLQVKKDTEHAAFNITRKKFSGWSLAVFVGSYLVELLGVQSGIIFGNYYYGDTLQPMLANVPVVIGCAWLNMLLSSAAIAQKMLPPRIFAHPLGQAFAIAVLMVLFDAFMEPAAMKLGYWHWRADEIPFRNFVAWFVFGLTLAYWGARWQIFPPRTAVLPIHAYLAQLGYFSIVNFFA